MVNHSDVAAMARLLDITGTPERIVAPGMPPQSGFSNSFDRGGEPVFSAAELLGETATTSSTGSTPSMKAMLEAVVQAEGGELSGRLERASRAIVQSDDPSLREALETERTSTGAKLGVWEIRKDTTTGVPLFSVVHSESRSVIADELSLYEAAYGIAKALHNGRAVNSHPVMTLLRAERDYASALQDAIVFKHRAATAKKSDPRRPIFEDRYEAAKGRAMLAQDQVKKLSQARF